MVAAAADTTKPLPDVYADWLALTIDEKGVEIPHALALDLDGTMTVYALALPIEQAYRLMLTKWASGEHAELLFAFDRFAKPGQGTTLGDLMAGFHIVGRQPRPFIIEYQHDPRIVKAVEWGNPFWTDALTRELATNARLVFGSARL